MSNPEKFASEPFIMLKWFNSELVVRNMAAVRDLFRPLLRRDVIQVVQDYLSTLAKGNSLTLSKRRADTPATFINIHVRRTDYINFIAERYKGHQVNENYFFHCIEKFLKEDSNSIFLVTSDDIGWCREHLQHDKVFFPQLLSSADPIVTDFMLMTQVNHTIYDYGSFAFWGAVLAGGRTFVADGYSSTLHPMLAAIKKHKPRGWKTVDVRKLP